MRRVLVASAACALLAASSVTPSAAQAGFTPALVSGLESGPGNGASSVPAAVGGQTAEPFGRFVSESGRFVAFTSAATDLVPNDKNGATDVFMLDREAGTVELISATGKGSSGAGASSGPNISGDGRLVVFRSAATDLVEGDANGRIDIFVRDRDTGQTVAINRDAAGAIVGDNAAQPPTSSGGIPAEVGPTVYVISRDGSTVVLRVGYPLAPNDTNGFPDVYAIDLANAFNGRFAPELLSVNLNGVAGDGASHQPSVSASGRRVAFRSGATTMDMLGVPDLNCGPPGGNPGCGDIFMRDRDSQTTTLVTVSISGTTSGDGIAAHPMISENGEVIAFSGSGERNLTDPAASGNDSLFVRDLAAGTTREVMPEPSMGHQSNVFRPHIGISADGQRVVYETRIPRASGGLNKVVAVWDAKAGTRPLGPRTTSATANTSSVGPSISADGRMMTFVSNATDLVDGIKTSRDRVYVYDIDGDTLTMASTDQTGSAEDVNATSRTPSLSADGSLVVFQSAASNVVAGDANGADDVFAVPLDAAQRGIADTLEIDGDGSENKVTGHLHCLADDAEVDVTVTQGAASGTGTTVVDCELGADAKWSASAVPADGSPPFHAGKAEGCATARFSNSGSEVQRVDWCKPVTLAVASSSAGGGSTGPWLILLALGGLVAGAGLFWWRRRSAAKPVPDAT